MATVTVAEVKEIIKTGLPDAVIQAFINTVDKADLCLAGYDLPDDTIKVMKQYAVAHMIETSSRGDVSSQSAPSGASRSFRDRKGLQGTNFGMTLEMMTGYSCIQSVIDNTQTLYLRSINPRGR